MKRTALCLAVFLSAALVAVAPAQANPQLESVLNAMDKAAANFRTAEAGFEWDQYQKVVDETDTQKGTIYFRRNGKDLQMAADITDPGRYLLFTGGKVQVYEPKIDQVTEYDAGKNKGDVESFLVLGFGGGGHDLLKSFDVSYGGAEQIGGVQTQKLLLKPKSAKAQGMFEQIILWIDPSRGISVQQKFIEPQSGNYRLVKYSEIKLNQKIPDNVFKLRTTGKTKYVHPQG